jgi:hypothetical protein
MLCQAENALATAFQLFGACHISELLPELYNRNPASKNRKCSRSGGTVKKAIQGGERAN